MAETNEHEGAMPDKPFFAKWQHVIALGSLFVAILGGGIAVYFQFFARDEARLDTEFLAEVVIAELTHNATGKLRLSHENETLESASTVSLLVTNTGRTDLTPRNNQNPGDLKNARIRISLEPGMTILEAIAQPTGDDASSVLEKLESPEKNVATFVVLLMNVDAQVKVDLIVAGVDVAETLTVTALGKGVKGKFLRSKSNMADVLGVALMSGGGVSVGFLLLVLFYLARSYRVLRGEQDPRAVLRIREQVLYLVSALIVPLFLVGLLSGFSLSAAAPFLISASLVFLPTAVFALLWRAWPKAEG